MVSARYEQPHPADVPAPAMFAAGCGDWWSARVLQREREGSAERERTPSLIALSCRSDSADAHRLSGETRMRDQCRGPNPSAGGASSLDRRRATTSQGQERERWSEEQRAEGFASSTPLFLR